MSIQTVSADVKATILGYYADGKKVNVIAMLTQTKKAIVEAVIAEAQAGAVEGTTENVEAEAVNVQAEVQQEVQEEVQQEIVQEVQEEVQQEVQEEVKEESANKNKLAALLAQAEANKIAEAASPTGTDEPKKERKPRAKKDPIDDTKRDVIAIISESTKTVFLTARRNYSNKTMPAVLARAKLKEAGKVKMDNLLACEDVQAVLIARVETVGADIEKAKVHAQYEAQGYTVVSTCKKIVEAVKPAEPVVQDAPVQEEQEEVVQQQEEMA